MYLKIKIDKMSAATMQNKLVEIQVHGFTGDGKTHVCSIIRQALTEAYGTDTQIVSRVLSEEPKPKNKPKKNVIFSIEEYNHGCMGTYNT